MRKWRRSILGLVIVGVLPVVGCGTGDSSVVVTFTDEHGRACTVMVIDDSDDADLEASALDCDYPPTGVTTGADTWTPLSLPGN